MSEERREFGRDGVSGMVDRPRALRARLVPPPPRPRGEESGRPGRLPGPKPTK